MKTKQINIQEATKDEIININNKTYQSLEIHGNMCIAKYYKYLE